ncbi:hypothetical protein ACFRI7_31665 [Streptomyces sp. NPDC056716]|uniref:hypothetical protein n=1 Tax=unclassified Streptomyces TaxID=2593676 RepID=UPI0036C127A5
MTPHAVRLDIADATTTVMSADQAITDWTARYFGPWWNATPVAPDHITAGPAVIAGVDSDRYQHMALDVTQAPHTSVEYAKAQHLITRDEATGVIRALCPQHQLCYRSEPGRGQLHIVGRDTESVATATARLARETVRGSLLRDGWAVLHASAVVGQDGGTILTFGHKGAGKTTTALALAVHQGLRLLANDRVFVRPRTADEGVDVLPWPSAAAIGLGLLSALNWFDIAQERLRGGEQLHPTQHQKVTAALLAGQRTPLWDHGKELKAQVFPDQFERWFSLPLATGGKAAALLFPRIEADATPAMEDSLRSLGDDDFMSGRTEDRYPDVFALTQVDGGGTEKARQEVAQRLGALPHHSVVLGYDMAANVDLLAEVVGLPAGAGRQEAGRRERAAGPPAPLSQVGHGTVPATGGNRSRA